MRLPRESLDRDAVHRHSAPLFEMLEEASPGNWAGTDHDAVLQNTHSAERRWAIFEVKAGCRRIADLPPSGQTIELRDLHGFRGRSPDGRPGEVRVFVVDGDDRTHMRLQVDRAIRWLRSAPRSARGLYR